MNFIIVILLLLSSVIFPQVTSAASVYFISNSQNIYIGDVFAVEVRVSSPEEMINVADGSFSFNGNILEIKELSMGGSIFNLWAQQPTFFNEKGLVSFVGGTSGGFQREKGLMLKAIFAAKEEGDSELAFGENFSVFRGDGKGTKINPERKSLIISVVKRPEDVMPKDEWQSFVAEDKTPPELFEALIVRDQNMFDNKYFVNFFTTDKESGIAYFEVKEGARDFVRAESPYLLNDQSLGDVVQIRAIDKAGNERVVVAEISSVPFYKNTLFWIAILFFLFVVVSFFKLKNNPAKSEQK